MAHVLEHTDAFAPLPDDIYPPAPGNQQYPPGNMTPFGPAISHRSYDISILWTLLYLSKIILLRSHPAMPPAAQMAAGVCASATAPYCTLIGRITAGLEIPVSSDLSPFLGAVLTEASMSMFFAGVTYHDARQREWLVTRLLQVEKRTGWANAGMIAKACETVWEKAAEMKRGPPYTRRTKRPMRLKEEDGYIDAPEELLPSQDSSGAGGAGASAGLANRVWELDGAAAERRFVFKSKLPPWAMNLLGTEEDLREKMEKVGL